MKSGGWLIIGLLAMTIVVWLAASISSSTPPSPDDPRLHTGERGIALLVADWCRYCRQLEADFNRHNVPYTRIDIDTLEGQNAMQAIGERGVPVTIIGQTVIPGLDTQRIQSHLSPLGYQVY